MKKRPLSRSVPVCYCYLVVRHQLSHVGPVAAAFLLPENPVNRNESKDVFQKLFQ